MMQNGGLRHSRWDDGVPERKSESGQADAETSSSKETRRVINGGSTPRIPSSNGRSLRGLGESRMPTNGVRIIPPLVDGRGRTRAGTVGRGTHRHRKQMFPRGFKFLFLCTNKCFLELPLCLFLCLPRQLDVRVIRELPTRRQYTYHTHTQKDMCAGCGKRKERTHIVRETFQSNNSSILARRIGI